MDHEYQHGPGASKGHGDLWRMSNPENEQFFISDILSLLIARAMDGVAGQCVLGLNQYKLQVSVQLPANLHSNSTPTSRFLTHLSLLLHL